MDRDYDHRVVNVVVAFDLHRRVDTVRLYNDWCTGVAFKGFRITVYDDEDVSGWLDIKPPGSGRNAKLRLYPSGRGMVVGARSEEEALGMIDSVLEELEPYTDARR